MLYSLVLFIFVIICLLLVVIILLQTSQTGGMGSIGGGNSYLEGALGGQGADTLLLRTTTIFAVTFMCLAIFLNYLDDPKVDNNITVKSVHEYSEGDDQVDVQDQNQLDLENPENSNQVKTPTVDSNKNKTEKDQVPLKVKESDK